MDLTGYNNLTNEQKKLLDRIKKQSDLFGNFTEQMVSGLGFETTERTEELLRSAKEFDAALQYFQLGFMRLTQAVVKPENRDV